MSTATCINPFFAGSSVTGVPLLDLADLGGAVAAYSMARKLRSDYSGSAFRVYRASDDAEQDIGFIGNEVNVAALVAFCTGTVGRLRIWYDQSGNGIDIRNNTGDPGGVGMPLIYNYAEIQLNGKQCAYCNGDHVATPSHEALLNFGTCTMALVADSPERLGHLQIVDRLGSVSGVDMCRGTIQPGRIVASYDDGPPDPVNVSFRDHDNPPANGAPFLQIGLFGSTSADLRNRMNGVESTAPAQPAEALPNQPRLIYVGVYVDRDGLANYLTGNVQEIVVWADAILGATAIAHLESNVNTYYSIY